MGATRLLRITRWSLACAALVLMGAFGLSLRYHVTIRHPGAWRVEFSGGAARVNWASGPGAGGPTEYDAGRHSTPVEWWPRTSVRVGWPGFILPLWLPALAGAIGAAVLWRRERPRRSGHCPACGYLLRGLPGGVPCPECGRRTSCQGGAAADGVF